MTSISDFKPSNAFEVFFKHYLEDIECYPSQFIIDRIFRQVYDTTDDQSMITAKFSMINSIINQLLLAHGSSADSLIHFKNDIDLVLVFSGITIKIYNLDKVKTREHDKLYSLLLKNECPYLEPIYRAFSIDSHKLFVVVSKTLDTSYKSDVSSEADTIRDHVDKALKYLKSHGWNQCDTSIDNLGFDQDNKCFSLFDFGGSKQNTDLLEFAYKEDLHSLNRSIRFHSS